MTSPQKSILKNKTGTSQAGGISKAQNVFKICSGRFHEKLFFGIFFAMSPLQQKGGPSETLLNTCIAHSNSADLLLFNNASDWRSEDFDNNKSP